MNKETKRLIKILGIKNLHAKLVIPHLKVRRIRNLETNGQTMNVESLICYAVKI